MSFQEIIENLIPKLQTLVNFNILSLYIVLKGGLIKRTVFSADEYNGKKIHETFIKNSELQKPHKGKGMNVNAALWYVLNEKKPLFHKNLSLKGCSFPEDVELVKQGITSKILIPLLVKDKVTGIVEVAGKQAFNENDLLFLQQVADQLAVCLENVSLYNEVWQHKQEWEITFSAVTDLLVFINLHYEIQRVNKAAADFLLSARMRSWAKMLPSFYAANQSATLPGRSGPKNKTAYLQAHPLQPRPGHFCLPGLYRKEEPYGVTYYAKDVTSFVDSIKLVSLGEMSAGVAHELNSPLTAIVGNSQLLLRETDESSPHYQLIKDIAACGVRCQRIIQNLLTFSRQDEFSFEEIDLNQIVEKGLGLIAYQIEKNKIDIVQELSTSLPTVLGNPQGLEQILINLLLNAKDAIEEKYMDNGSQEKGKIIVRTRAQPGKFVAVDIIDNGCGIEPEKIPSIFNPFFTSKKVGKGTGMGLSVSLGIAQSHRGFINAESTPGQGSIFSLILPVSASVSEESAVETVGSTKIN